MVRRISLAGGLGRRGLAGLLCAGLLAGMVPVVGADSAGVRHSPAVVMVCHNYGCAKQAAVRVDTSTLWWIDDVLQASADAAAEREALSRVLAQLYRLAARQSPVGNDRAGNFLDDGVEGRMDCIDHATTSTRWLALLEARGMLRFHRVLEPARRTRFILQHFSAVVEVLAQEPAADAPALEPAMLAAAEHGAARYDVAPEHAQAPATVAGERFAIDAWFVDHGEPAVVLPLDEWLKGGGPNVH
ncbi:hypothetical protein [Thauera sp.]|uniref:hypothetical protein n=2 Tax=unclassified Thauera TaxID=2609274 RepID=UPI002587E288|nr:hypothetical protein [Thauera sp.]HNR59997.1 hypothetical protein [Thauera sp.]HNS91573.1 hypothetical protein [Thauera sp.]HRJ23280.1 hypothetical protein [Thauera sp.]HRK09915.1 hypothetical protein [Thauera sp.]